MRLIDADHLRKWIIANWHSGWHHKTVDDILDQIDREDTYIEDADIVDAEPIIRCKECKYWSERFEECHIWDGVDVLNIKADDFCSRGERKDD